MRKATALMIGMISLSALLLGASAAVLVQYLQSQGS